MNKCLLARSVVLPLLLAGLSVPHICLAQAVFPDAAPQADTLSPTRIDPFAGFETHYLSNGLKVWFKRLEHAPRVSASVVVPYGWDVDPPGKEELAHFTEHMLFSDHDGRTEEEIIEAIQSLGGYYNGFTYSDRTAYFVTIAKEHGPLAIEWLSRIVSPHAMDPDVVERNRQPVAVELSARPLQVFELAALALNPSWLLPPNVWKREFGMETRPLIYDPWASLHRITPEDLRGFYDRYYAPGAMTLTIVGDLDRDETLALAERMFGVFPEREVAPQAYEVEDPGRRRATYSWGFGADIRYDRRFKFFRHTADDELHLMFIRDLLARRLNQRLRYGERKAAYTPGVALVKRGPAAYLQIETDINEGEYDYALEVFTEELESLRAGTLDPAEFEEDRRALIEQRRTISLTAGAVAAQARIRFYNPDVFTDFPDILGFFGAVSQADLASFVQRSFVAERETISIGYQQPVSQAVIVLALILLVLLTHRGISWALTQPIEMKQIRYVARLRTPLAIRFARVVLFGGGGLVLGRLFVAFLMWAGATWVVTVESYVIQSASWALMLSGSIALVVVYLSRFPRKLLVFPDHIRVKSRAYSSRVLEPTDIAEISLRRFSDVWLSRDIFRCTALTFGIIRPGLYVRPKRGRALFFQTRDTAELAGVLGEWRGEPVSMVAGSQASSEAPVSSPSPTERAEPTAEAPEPADLNSDDADLDSVGLTEEEKKELLGE